MNREILFRGFNPDEKGSQKVFVNGKCIRGFWVYGFYLYDPNFKEHQIAGYDFDDKECGQVETYYQYKVIPESVGQYTGLTDENGKKIFEGDIITCSQEICGNQIDKVMEIGFVEMKHGAFGLHRRFTRVDGAVVDGYYRAFKDWLEDYDYEVIGTIHDNPELIGGDGDG